MVNHLFQAQTIPANYQTKVHNLDRIAVDTMKTQEDLSQIVLMVSCVKILEKLPSQELKASA